MSVNPKRPVIPRPADLETAATTGMVVFFILGAFVLMIELVIGCSAIPGEMLWCCVHF
jgi:hypothetical protein